MLQKNFGPSPVLDDGPDFPCRWARPSSSGSAYGYRANLFDDNDGARRGKHRDAVRFNDGDAWHVDRHEDNSLGANTSISQINTNANQDKTILLLDVGLPDVHLWGISPHL